MGAPSRLVYDAPIRALEEGSPLYQAAWQQTSYRFADLKELMAKATPLRSGDVLAGVAATSAEENVAAKMALADVPLQRFLTEALIPYESDDVTRLILDSHDEAAFAPISHMTVGAFRDWLLSETATTEVLSGIAPGLTPEMVAATAKIMRNQDLILAARKVEVVTRFRDTIGLKGRMAVRLQPNHPTDDKRGIAASIVDGLMLGCGDAVIGINPASDNVGGDPRSPRHARRHHPPLRDPHAGVRADPRHHLDRGHGARRARRSRVPVDRGHRGRQRLLRRDARAASRRRARPHSP